MDGLWTALLCLALLSARMAWCLLVATADLDRRGEERDVDVDADDPDPWGCWPLGDKERTRRFIRLETTAVGLSSSLFFSAQRWSTYCQNCEVRPSKLIKGKELRQTFRGTVNWLLEKRMSKVKECTITFFSGENTCRRERETLLMEDAMSSEKRCSSML